jgi:hypothetical protein
LGEVGRRDDRDSGMKKGGVPEDAALVIQALEWINRLRS